MTVPQPFVIFGLPRSRTAWLAGWLTDGMMEVGHDIAIECDSVTAFLERLWTLAGTVETGAMQAAPLIRQAMPQARFVTIRRPRAEVERSLARIPGVPIEGLRGELMLRDALLDEIETAGALSIPFRTLDTAEVAASLWETLHGTRFDFDRWRAFKRREIQIDMAARLVLLGQRRDAIAAAREDCEALLERMDRGENLLFARVAVETWNTLWPEAEPLAMAHSIEVNAGERPGHPFRMDTVLMGQLERAGRLRIITARVNARLVGYWLWTLSTDAESTGVMLADQGPVYVIDDPRLRRFRFLNRMWHASHALLRSLGVQSVQFHHQINGRGAMLGAWFQRLGAIEHQRRYTLWIGDESHG